MKETEPAVPVNLALKVMEDQDINALWDIIEKNKVALRPWLDWVDQVQSLEEYKTYMQRVKYEESIGIQKHFVLTVNNKVAGEIVFDDFDGRVRSCNMGYWLDPELHRQGIMLSACTKAIDLAFDSLNIEKIVIRFIGENVASMKLAQKLGFKIDGVLRKNILYHGIIRDEIVMSCFQSEWNSLN